MSPTRPIALLLLPGYSALAAGALLEAFYRANDLQDEAEYRPQPVSVSGGPVAASSGAQFITEALDPQLPWHALFVLSGERAPASAALLALLRELGARSCVLAGVDGGSAVLAAAGLLQGERASVHWTLAETLMEAYPAVVWSGQVWEINTAASRLSCGGGTACLDLALAWLGRLHGERLAQELSLALGLERLRGRDERQRRPSSERAGSPKLAEALALMEANLAEPLPTEEVARLVGVSRRQLERLFKQHLDSLPSRYYLELRLNRARRLLQQSSQSILQIGLSCGFSSGPHFSNSYKASFGHTPRDERSQRAAAWRNLPSTEETPP